MKPRLRQHFPAHKDQYRRNAGIEITEIWHSTRQKKIECAQPQNRADVRCVDDERVSRDSKDGWNGIHGKNQIRGFQHEQRKKERSRHSVPILLDEESLMTVWRDGENPASPTQDRILLKMKITVAQP